MKVSKHTWLALSPMLKVRYGVLVEDHQRSPTANCPSQVLGGRLFGEGLGGLSGLAVKGGKYGVRELLETAKVRGLVPGISTGGSSHCLEIPRASMCARV